MRAAGTAAPAAAVPDPRVRRSSVTRAPGVELLGEYQGSGEHRPPQLARLADGRVVQLTPALYAVVAAAGDGDDAAAIADAVRSDHPDLDADSVQQLVDDHLRPAGLVENVDGSTELPERDDPLTALRLRRATVSPDRVRRWSDPLRPLMAWPLVIASLVSFVVLEALVLLDGRVTPALATTFTDPATFFGVLALTLVGGAFHELGHAAALRAAGGTPGEMGVGLYLVWPAFYTDVTDAYRLSRRDRLRVDLAGLHCNAVFTIVILAAWSVTGSPVLLAAALFQGVQALQQLLPVVRFDGYYIAADLAGVPDLFQRLPDLLRGFVPGARPSSRVANLTTRARRIASAWVVGVAAVFTALVVRLFTAGPTIVSSTVARVDDRIGAATAAVDTGDLALAASQAVSAVIALFVPAGLLYVAARLLRRLGRGLARRTPRRSRNPNPAQAAPVSPPTRPVERTTAGPDLTAHERRRFDHVAALGDPAVHRRPVPRVGSPMRSFRVAADAPRIERQLHEPLPLAVALGATVGTGADGRALRCPTVTDDGRRLQPAQVVRKRTSKPGVTTYLARTAAGESGWLDIWLRPLDDGTGVFAWFDGPEPVARIWDLVLDAIARMDAP